jgi:hypothetical protein
MSVFGARAIALIKELRSLVHLPLYNENAIREIVSEIDQLQHACLTVVQYVVGCGENVGNEGFAIPVSV